MADINEFAQTSAQHEEIVTGPILKPNGEPFLADDGSECTISVRSEYAKAVQDALVLHDRRATKRGKQVELVDLIKSRREAKCVAAIVSWHGWTANGQPWPCTPENVRAFISDPHRLEQVEELIARHASFFVKPSAA